MRLIYSREALIDLIRLRDFIAENNPVAATRIAEALVARIENLRQFPRMGIAVEKVPPPAEIRDMVFRHYVVRYSVHTGALAVLRIWHHSEDRE